MADGQLLTAAELGKRLGVGRSSIYRMAGKNLIPYKVWGANLGSLRFDEDEVREALGKLTRPRRARHEAVPT